MVQCQSLPAPTSAIAQSLRFFARRTPLSCCAPPGGTASLGCGVNSYRTGDGTASITCAGLDGVVLILTEESLRYDAPAGLSQHLAADHNSLPRRRGDMPTWAYRLAIATFDATITSSSTVGTV